MITFYRKEIKSKFRNLLKGGLARSQHVLILRHLIKLPPSREEKCAHIIHKKSKRHSQTKRRSLALLCNYSHYIFLKNYSWQIQEMPLISSSKTCPAHNPGRDRPLVPLYPVPSLPTLPLEHNWLKQSVILSWEFGIRRWDT